MMIEDEELRLIFKTASEEHLQHLDDGLLFLEKNPDDQATLEALMREAHSLKGDANLLGVKDVGTLAHQIEHILTQIKQHQEVLSPDLADRLARSLGAMRCLVHEAVTGEPSGVDTFRVLAELMGAEKPGQPEPILKQPQQPEMAPQLLQAVTQVSESQPAPQLEAEVPAEQPESQDEIEVSSEPVHASPVSPVAASLVPPASPFKPEPQGPTSPLPAAGYRIETIRVPTRELDSLMTQAGELTVTKIRVAHRLTEVEEIANLWEEWSRDLFAHRFVWHNDRQATDSRQRLEHLYSQMEQRLEQLGSLVKSLGSALNEDTTRLELISHDLEEGIRTLRLLPLSTIFNFFPRMVRDLAREEGKLVDLIIEGGETRADKRILEEMKDPLMHILRNAVDHGIEFPSEREQRGKPATATIRLRGYQTPTSIVLEVVDDGKGLNLDKIKQTALKRGICREDELETMSTTQIQNLIFAPGFSTCSLVTEVSGRGVGLDVVQTQVEKLKGNVQVESTPGQGTTFRIQLGLTLATVHVLIVALNGIPYAIPVEFVQMACLVNPAEVFTVEGRETIIQDGKPLSVARLSDLLELPDNSPLAQTSLPCIILQAGPERLGVFVDSLIDEQDVVLKPQSRLLKRVRNVTGATILGTGEVCMILNPQDLIKSVRRSLSSTSRTQSATAAPVRYTILLAEDSIATRTQEKRILESAGYEVVTAVDGLDAYNKLRLRSFDAVISDVQMPNLDGLEFAARVRQHREFDEMPFILVTSLASDEDKRRGAEAGANAYITKGNFNQAVLLETLQRLI